MEQCNVCGAPLEDADQAAEVYRLPFEMDSGEPPLLRVCRQCYLEVTEPESDLEATEEEIEAAFEMPVRDVFAISGKGTVATGCIARGIVRVGDPLVIEKADGRTLYTVCTGVETFRKEVTEAVEGDHVGLVLKGISKDDVEMGDTIYSAGTSAPGEPDLDEDRFDELLREHGVEDISPEHRRRILGFLRLGRKLQAIKELRGCTLLGLKEAKEAVEAIGEQLGVEWQRSESCFIATAACGSDLAEHVVQLREFRETVLRPRRAGRAFIAFYEMLSPPAAKVIARSARLRTLARRLIVRPGAAIAGLWICNMELGKERRGKH